MEYCNCLGNSFDLLSALMVFAVCQDFKVLGADYMSRAGSVEGLALSAEVTAQPGIT